MPSHRPPEGPRPACGSRVWPRLAALVLLTVSTLPLARGQEAFGPVDPRLLGAWQEVAAEGETGASVEIAAGRLAFARDGRIERIGRVLGQRGAVLTVSFWGNRWPMAVDLEGDRLALTWTPTPSPFSPSPATESRRYQKLAETPAVFRLTPLALGEPGPLDPDRVAAIQGELAARKARDQEVRQPFTAGGNPGPEAMARLSEVDRANTAWLGELVREVGWIDARRFGPEAANAAFLLVQHSGHLPLMLAALPEILEDVEAGVLAGSAYALLYDRTRLNLGEPQRYGSQLTWDADGLFVAPLADPAGVDARRAELGMKTLAEYLGLFGERDGGRAIPIRERF